MTSEWLARVETNLSSVTDSLITYTIDESDNWRKRNAHLSHILDLPCLYSHPFIQAKLSLSLAREGIKAVIQLHESNDWREALQCLHEMYRYIELSRAKLALTPNTNEEKGELLIELEDVNDSYISYFCIVQADQFIFQGDELKNTLLLHEESLEMDLAWRVVDLYRHAINLAQTKPNPSLEAEAKATSRLGHLYYKVLKLETVGYNLLKYVLQLMVGQSGLKYLTEDWYLEAKAIVEESQKKREAYNDAEVAKQREGTIKKIQPHLDAMKAVQDRFARRDYYQYDHTFFFFIDTSFFFSLFNFIF